MPRRDNWLDRVVPHQHVSNGFGHYVAEVTAQANAKQQADIERQAKLRAHELDPEAWIDSVPMNGRLRWERRNASYQQAMREMEFWLLGLASSD